MSMASADWQLLPFHLLSLHLSVSFPSSSCSILLSATATIVIIYLSKQTLGRLPRASAAMLPSTLRISHAWEGRLSCKPAGRRQAKTPLGGGPPMGPAGGSVLLPEHLPRTACTYPTCHLLPSTTFFTHFTASPAHLPTASLPPAYLPTQLLTLPGRSPLRASPLPLLQGGENTALPLQWQPSGGRWGGGAGGAGRHGMASGWWAAAALQLATTAAHWLPYAGHARVCRVAPLRPTTASPCAAAPPATSTSPAGRAAAMPPSTTAWVLPSCCHCPARRLVQVHSPPFSRPARALPRHASTTKHHLAFNTMPAGNCACILVRLY